MTAIVLTKEEVLAKQAYYLPKLKNSLVVYPTDTIYGIGCDATNEQLVLALRKLKGSPKPHSVIAPAKSWITSNCIVPPTGKVWLSKLPGPYTLILKLKQKMCIHPDVNVYQETLGIRMPKHWFLDIVHAMQVPFITTSANLTGNTFMTSLETMDPSLREKADYIIYEGPINGKPSTLVDLSGKDVSVKER